MFCYIKLDKWDKTRKFAVVGELNSEKGRKQQSLFEADDYNHAIYVTNTTWGTTETVRFYEKRDNCENYIKKSKYDMNIGSLKTKSLSRK